MPTPWLDNKHTVFGTVVSEADQDVVNSISQGDKISAIAITGDTEALLAKTSEQIEQWNALLDRSFPNLK